MDIETMYMLNFAEHLGDVLDNANMDKELKILYEFGKFYSEHHKLHLENNCAECTNLEMDKEALEAFKKVAAMAYAITHRLNSLEEGDSDEERNSDDEE